MSYLDLEKNLDKNPYKNPDKHSDKNQNKNCHIKNKFEIDFKTDVLIIGAGAAGMMCGIEAGKRGRSVFILDHANKPGKKIIMSGGGRCNFTNLHTHPDCYISHNAHFCKSALSRYTPQDFIDLVQKHKIKFHEKTLGQLFCDNKSSEIVNMLLKELEDAGVRLFLNTKILEIKKQDNYFYIQTSMGLIQASSLIIATGGLSIPTMGATPFAYKIAEQFNLKLFPTRAGLVPLTLDLKDKEKWSDLSGISALCEISSESGKKFKENLLITHRGLSGPAVLQISSYWHPGEVIKINLLDFLLNNSERNLSFEEFWKDACEKNPKSMVKNFFGEFLPKRLVLELIPENLAESPLKTLIPSQIQVLNHILTSWEIKPGGSEGYRTAEVTLGGIDCNELSSKTMEARSVPGLYFIGECMDITGWLGGYNFQWAWASGWAAGQVV